MNEKTRAEQIELISQSVSKWDKWRAERVDRADLREANLQDANLAGADLQGADLQGADLGGGIKIIRLICRVSRSDDYLFMGFSTTAGLMIKAGCRLMTPTNFRGHIAREYPDTAKASETLAIIKYIEECAARA